MVVSPCLLLYGLEKVVSRAIQLELQPGTHSSILKGTLEPLYQVKLLAALRSGEIGHGFPVKCSDSRYTLGDTYFIHAFLAEIGKDRRRTGDGDSELGAAALHLAIRCASGELLYDVPLAAKVPDLLLHS
jgi:hypothetical protein